MKKQGFTLVELLAVVAILAVLVIIALPNVLSMFNDAKESTFTTEVETIYKQAETDFMQDNLNDAGPKVYCKITDSTYGTCPSDSKPLNLTTTKSYLIRMNSDGSVEYIGVADKSFVYGRNRIKSIDKIKKEDVVDASTEGLDFKLYVEDDNYIRNTTNCVEYDCAA